MRELADGKLAKARRLLKRSGRSGRVPALPAALFVQHIGAAELHGLLASQGYQLGASASLYQRSDDAVTVKVSWRKRQASGFNISHVAYGTLPTRLVLWMLDGMHRGRQPRQ